VGKIYSTQERNKKRMQSIGLKICSKEITWETQSKEEL